MLTMTIDDLKDRIKDLPGDMEVVIPVITEDDANNILAFRRVKTAGILESVNEDKPALYLGTASGGLDIAAQIDMRMSDQITCKQVLF